MAAGVGTGRVSGFTVVVGDGNGAALRLAFAFVLPFAFAFSFAAGLTSSIGV